MRATHVGASWLGAALGVYLAGCATTIPISPKLTPPPRVNAEGGTVAVAAVAEGVPDHVGSETFSIFAIPIEKIRLDEEQAAATIMEGFRNALQAAGYRVVNREEHPGAPLLTCQVLQIEFKSRPIVFHVYNISGTVRARVALHDSSGKTVWVKEYESRSNRTGPGETIYLGLLVAMNDLLSRAAEDFTTAEFHSACCGSAVGPYESTTDASSL
jgi:hypothetical protein